MALFISRRGQEVLLRSFIFCLPHPSCPWYSMGLANTTVWVSYPVLPDVNSVVQVHFYKGIRLARFKCWRENIGYWSTEIVKPKNLFPGLHSFERENPYKRAIENTDAEHNPIGAFPLNEHWRLHINCLFIEKNLRILQLLHVGMAGSCDR